MNLLFPLLVSSYLSVWAYLVWFQDTCTFIFFLQHHPYNASQPTYILFEQSDGKTQWQRVIGSQHSSKGPCNKNHTNWRVERGEKGHTCLAHTLNRPLLAGFNSCLLCWQCKVQIQSIDYIFTAHLLSLLVLLSIYKEYYNHLFLI